MRHLLLAISVFVFGCTYAQTESKTAESPTDKMCRECDSLYNRVCRENSDVFGHPEFLPEFSKGWDALFRFFRANIQYPPECKRQGIEGRVIVKFIIDESGKIICPYVLRPVHPALDKEALRVVKLMPDWKPASNNGVPCKSCFTLPVSFRL